MIIHLILWVYQLVHLVKNFEIKNEFWKGNLDKFQCAFAMTESKTLAVKIYQVCEMDNKLKIGKDYGTLCKTIS